MATLLELKGENPFRVRAYRNGARALLNLEEDLVKVIREKRLTEFAGIGDHLAEKITQLYQTNQLDEYDQLKKSIPQGLLELIQVQGLGPKKVKLLYEKLKIKNIQDLKKAAEGGKIGKIKGFGEKTEKNILKALEHREIYQKRSLWWDGWQRGVPLLAKLKKVKGVKQAELCGSLRRKEETIGDLDLLVGSDQPASVIRTFAEMGEEIVAKGDTKCTIRLEDGMQADLRVVAPDQYIYGLIYFTGSKEHNIELRNRSLKKGWSLSEYGFKGEKKKVLIPKIKTEEEFYKLLGLSYIPPELRENMGEIEAAEKGMIPQLIEVKDIRGTLHNHTTASDGKSTLHEMVEAAEKMGWEYIGITDHSKSSFQANGLSEERLYEQIEQIRKMKSKVHIFSGSECDILPDGSLDYPNALLQELDVVVASVHSSLNQDEKTMTKRIIKALEHPMTTMLGHPTGRLLLKREASAVNLAKVIDAAIANQKIIELNGNPKRLDLEWRLWHKASEKGLLCCINCDAHSAEQLQFIETGVNSARKGWLTKKKVINTLSLKEMKSYLLKMRGKKR